MNVTLSIARKWRKTGTQSCDLRGLYFLVQSHFLELVQLKGEKSEDLEYLAVINYEILEYLAVINYEDLEIMCIFAALKY